MSDRERVLPIGRSRPPRRLVVISASTGGPSALYRLFGELPMPLGAGVIVVQHMPEGFTAALAARLDRSGSIRVREAVDGDLLTDDLALVAPGNRHLVVDAFGRVQILDTPRINGVRPSADVTLLAAAPAWGPRLLSVVMTGMGADGTAGSTAVRAQGGTVLAQDAASATVHGMPGSAIEAGAVDRVLNLEELAAAIATWAASPVRAPARREGPPLARPRKSRLSTNPR